MADLQIIYLFILLYLLTEIFKELLFPFSSSEIYWLSHFVLPHKCLLYLSYLYLIALIFHHDVCGMLFQLNAMCLWTKETLKLYV